MNTRKTSHQAPQTTTKKPITATTPPTEIPQRLPPCKALAPAVTTTVDIGPLVLTLRLALLLPAALAGHKEYTGVIVVMERSELETLCVISVIPAVVEAWSDKEEEPLADVLEEMIVTVTAATGPMYGTLLVPVRGVKMPVVEVGIWEVGLGEDRRLFFVVCVEAEVDGVAYVISTDAVTDEVVVAGVTVTCTVDGVADWRFVIVSRTVDGVAEVEEAEMVAEGCGSTADVVMPDTTEEVGL